ncbi:MAG: hypothetical protein SO360_05670 [Bifidobacterium tsurumiense]|uniref:hypothetical protein n=1 Tax=Bifidobacterium tsurumiense TaxID=356829 RepID=UPI002A815C5A|nr:hypothetical protein [Bifidobacterium tsurumiense]MDY4678329.1 hypothetical protein [Bifidobacterium tsurumiense]
MPPKQALFLSAPPEEAIGKATRWINGHRSTSQPLVSLKTVRKTYEKTGMRVSVVIHDNRPVLLLVHRLIDTIFDKIGDIDKAAESLAEVEKKTSKQIRKWDNMPPCNLVPGVKNPKLLQGRK